VRKRNTGSVRWTVWPPPYGTISTTHIGFKGRHQLPRPHGSTAAAVQIPDRQKPDVAGPRQPRLDVADVLLDRTLAGHLPERVLHPFRNSRNCIADTVGGRLLSKHKNRMKRFEALLESLPQGLGPFPSHTWALMLARYRGGLSCCVYGAGA
jgi:hypothetical protein